MTIVLYKKHKLPSKILTYLIGINSVVDLKNRQIEFENLKENILVMI